MWLVGMEEIGRVEAGMLLPLLRVWVGWDF